MPTRIMAGSATQISGTSTIRHESTACASVPATTKRSRLKRSRQRGKYSAAMMAPPPTHDSMTVKVPAPPPCRLRATSGSSATSAVDCRKKRKMRSRMTFSRGDCMA